MRGNATRAALPALALLALLAVVTVAAGGPTGTRSGETRTPAGVLFDTIFSLVLVGMLASAALLVYALAQGRSRGYPRTRGHLASLAMLAALAFLLANLQASGSILSQSDKGGHAPVIGAATNTPKNSAGQRSAPDFPWLPVTVSFALTATAVAAMLLSERRRRPREDARETVGETVVGVLEDALDELLAEANPRRAVIAAYARLERALAAQGLPRHAPETHEEYLARILGQLDVGTRSIRRLTDLFLRAKFSQHAVGMAMKQEAIALLAQVRDELRAAEEGRTEELGAPVTAGHE